MIIEGAFLKLPELLLGHMFPREQYEGTLINYFAMGVLLELSARNIELPMHRVHLERPYPEISNSQFPGRADLYVDLKGLYSRGLWHNLYGMKGENWIEAKFFGGIGRQGGTQTTTENSAFIAFDLFRLCLFVQEERSTDRHNGRYLLCVFNREPRDYLAFHRKTSSSPERQWLSRLLQPGDQQINISLAQEPISFRKIFGDIFVDRYQDLNLDLRIVVHVFSPIELSSEYLYWGYLVRVVDFEISLGDERLIYRDTSQEIWSAQQANIQTQLIEKVIACRKVNMRKRLSGGEKHRR